MATISPDDQARLDELSAQQAEVLTALAALKENLRTHAEELDVFAEEQKGIVDGLPQE